MKIRGWYISALLVVAGYALATIDMMDGTPISTNSVIDGISGVAKFNGQTVVDWNVQAYQQGHWKMNDDAANTTVAGSSFNGNDGTLGGGSNTVDISQDPGKIGKALLLDGVGDFINIDSVLSDVGSSTSGAFAVWVKPVDVTSDWLSFVTFNSTNSTRNLALLQDDGNGHVHAQARGSSQYKWVFDTDNIVLTNGVWAHIVLNYNGVEASLYVDGSLAPTTFSVDNDKAKWFNNLEMHNGRIGSFNDGGGEGVFFDGQVDDVRIFDRALTTEEIQELYNSGSGTEADSG